MIIQTFSQQWGEYSFIIMSSNAKPSAASHTLWTKEIYCLAVLLDRCGDDSRTPCYSFPEHRDTEHLTTAFFWLSSSLCKTHVWSQHHADLCGTGRGMKYNCPSRDLSFQNPQHPHLPLLWVTHARGWGSSQLKLYQLWSRGFTSDRKWVQTVKVWAFWARSERCLNTYLHLIHVGWRGQKLLCKLRHVLHVGQCLCLGGSGFI